MNYCMQQISANLMEANLDSMGLAVMAEDGKSVRALHCPACMADIH